MMQQATGLFGVVQTLSKGVVIPRCITVCRLANMDSWLSNFNSSPLMVVEKLFSVLEGASIHLLWVPGKHSNCGALCSGVAV